MAMIRTNAGRYNERYHVRYMFDRNLNTYWYSDSLYSYKIKTITIDFFVSILFEAQNFLMLVQIK